MGALHSTPNFGNFGWYIWTRPFRFGPPGIFGTNFEGGPLWPVGRTECLFPFDKIVIPAYKNNNQTRGGLGRVSVAGMYRTVPLGTWNFWNFKPEFLLNGMHPLSPLKCPTFMVNPIVNDPLFFELLRAKTDACSWSFFPFRTLFDNPLTTLPYGLLDSLSYNAKV